MLLTKAIEKMTEPSPWRAGVHRPEAAVPLPRWPQSAAKQPRVRRNGAAATRASRKTLTSNPDSNIAAAQDGAEAGRQAPPW